MFIFKNYFDGLWNQETYTLRGYDAIWSLYEEAFKFKEVKLIGARGYFFDKYPNKLKAFQELVNKTGVKIKNIIDFNAKGHPWLSIRGLETRYVSNEIVNPSVIWIFGNKIVITQWTEKDPIVLHINNKNVYESYSKQFELLWKVAKP